VLEALFWRTPILTRAFSTAPPDILLHQLFLLLVRKIITQPTPKPDALQ